MYVLCVSVNRNMREILLMLFLLSIIYSKTFLIKTKEDSEGKKNTGLDYRQNPLKKLIEKCTGQMGQYIFKSKFCRKWAKKW